MSNDKMDECKCERCLTSIDDSSDVKSLGEYDIICDTCADSFDECAGYNCDEVGTGFTETSSGNHYCSSCAENLEECYECEELVDSYNESLYEWDCNQYCSSCANNNYAYECNSCGCGIHISTAYNCSDYDWCIEEMCEECWERRSRIANIDSAVETSIDKSILDEAYIQPNFSANGKELTEAQSRDYQLFSKFFNQFYGYMSADYEKQKLIIKKGAFGYDRWGWFETSVNIQSEVNEKIYKMLDYLITENNQQIYRPHRKLGRYQPFAFAFAELCEFYISSDVRGDDGELLWVDESRYVKRKYPAKEMTQFMRWLTNKLEDAPTNADRERIWTDLELDGNLWFSCYVDFLDRAQLRRCVKDRKMPDGRCLIKTVNKIIAQHTKSAQQYWDEREELMETGDEIKANLQTSHPLAKDEFSKIMSGYKIKGCWALYGYENIWKKYCTNSIDVTIPARIGFDAKAHERVIRFNDSVGACQGASYKETLGFNHISMSSNPHLYLLFYDPEDETSIIGRSAIRLLWKRSSRKMGYGEPSRDVLYIAPSRLYLKGYSHGKNQFYAGMYKALNEWKGVIAERLGAKEVKMIAYHRTRHDSYSMRCYVDNAKDEKISIKVEERDPEYNEPKSGKFVTDWFYPIWLEKPEEEAYWGYYPDEYQGYESAYVDSSVYSSYATRETYNGQYSLIEVENE